jgi:hypothetical protein
MWVTHKTIVEDIRDFIFDAGLADIKNIDHVKMFVKIEGDREVVRYAVLQTAKKIDLVDRKWQRRCPASVDVANTLSNTG